MSTVYTILKLNTYKIEKTARHMVQAVRFCNVVRFLKNVANEYGLLFFVAIEYGLLFFVAIEYG